MGSRKYAKILHDAWEATLTHPRLKWFVFVPSFAAVLMFAAKIGWQLVMFLDKWEVIDFWKVGSEILGYILENGLVFWVVLAIILVVIFVYVVWAWVEATVMLAIKKIMKNPDTRISVRQNMIEATKYFFRIFELHAVLGVFSIWSIMLFGASMYRYLTPDLFSMLFPVLIIFSIVALFVNIFTSFAPYYVTHEDSGLLQSLRKSAGLVFMNFGSTLVIVFLIILVNIRIIINVLVGIGVPALLIWVFANFTNIFVVAVSILLGIILLALASYLTALVEIFTTGVWTKSFWRFRAAEEKLESAEAVITESTEESVAPLTEPEPVSELPPNPQS